MGITWIVTGRNGQLGRCLQRSVEARAASDAVVALSQSDLDIGDAEAVQRRLASVVETSPDERCVVVNAAAFTAVDRCETQSDEARRVNGEAPGHLARYCAELGAELVHISTDYVFDGTAKRPYREGDATNPQSVYGASKLEGEAAVRAVSSDFPILRTSWVFGPGRNFVVAILRQAALRRSGKVQEALRVVDDQRGCPTYAGDLAQWICTLVDAEARGTFHLSNAEDTTWWGFARQILDRSGYPDLQIERGRTIDLGLPAPRPAYSVLDCSRASEQGVKMRPWTAALEDYLASPEGRQARDEAA